MSGKTKSKSSATFEDLRRAVTANDLAELARLLERGADANATDAASGWTPLHLAASLGRLDCFRLLMDSGGKPTKKDKVGDTPLAVAVQYHQHPFVLQVHADALGTPNKTPINVHGEEVPDAYPDPIVTDDPAVLAYAAARSARPMVTVTDTETDQVDLRPKDHTPAVAANTAGTELMVKLKDAANEEKKSSNAKHTTRV